MECASSSEASFDSFKLNIESIDAQHKRVFQAYVTLKSAIEKDMGCEQAGIILYELTAYTREHLHYEEKKLRAANYPDLKPHIEAHREFQKKVDQLIERYDNEKFSDRAKCQQVALDVAGFICDWFRDHIKTMDRGYVRYLR